MDDQQRRRRASTNLGSYTEHGNESNRPAEREYQGGSTPTQPYPTPGYRSAPSQEQQRHHRQQEQTYHHSSYQSAPPDPPHAYPLPPGPPYGQTINIQVNTMPPVHHASSHFDGGLLELIGWSILGGIVTILSLGICYPWALCMLYGWKINHTVIEGRRLHFNGSAVSLFGHWIKWLLLTIITFGIYSLWVSINLEKWKVKNTNFE